MIQHHYSLKSFNTFGIDVKANSFTVVHHTLEVQKLIEDGGFERDFLILGGGSNILLTSDFNGLVIKNELRGIEILEEDDESILLRVGSGENWHEFVMHTLKMNWYGLENLSLIPGTVGAAPIQNIGAYGIELKSVFDRLETLELKTAKPVVFSNQECQFGYRDSIFKNSHKGQYFITHVIIRLSKVASVNIEYGAIKDILDEKSIEQPSPKDVSDAIIEIRQSKLPDPAEIGNSGSFFKNPEIPTEQFEKLRKAFPHIVGYPISNEITKVPAGWLIEQAGWKGKRFENIGVHEKQALVLVNYGGGSGKAIAELAFQIKDSVKEKFGITITPEVNIL